MALFALAEEPGGEVLEVCVRKRSTTVVTRPRRGLRRELLRWRDPVAVLYVAPAPEPEAHAAAFRALLRFTPAASKQIPHLAV